MERILDSVITKRGFRPSGANVGKADEVIEASIGPGCRSNVISRLAAIGVNALVVGCIGEGAVRVCGAHGIAVARGASGSTHAAALAYARGELEDSGQACGGACKAVGYGCR